MTTALNKVYSSLSMKRRYEVWFLRVGLVDGSGAWWFRYLLVNPGRKGCAARLGGEPVQVWATWFPRGGEARHWIEGFSLKNLAVSLRQRSPFSLSIGRNSIDESSCKGELSVDGHEVSWALRYQSRFEATLSNKGWIGFSRTPHSDAAFSGEIRLDGQTLRGEPLGLGLQGHNCGFRHRNFWTWAHAIFMNADGSLSSFEALVYEMPFGLVFRKTVLWHKGSAIQLTRFQKELRNRDSLVWSFEAQRKDGTRIEVAIDGSGPSIHRLPYLRTDCSGSFDVANNSLADAHVALIRPGEPVTRLATVGGAVLEMVGDPRMERPGKAVAYS